MGLLYHAKLKITIAPARPWFNIRLGTIFVTTTDGPNETLNKITLNTHV